VLQDLAATTVYTQNKLHIPMGARPSTGSHHGTMHVVASILSSCQVCVDFAVGGVQAYSSKLWQPQ
jgi:hypothetical protein